MKTPGDSTGIVFLGLCSLFGDLGNTQVFLTMKLPGELKHILLFRILLRIIHHFRKSQP